MSDWFIESANHCCGDFSSDVDEMALSGLTAARAKIVSPPLVAESAINMECKLVHKYEVKNAAGTDTTTVVIGQVVMFHVLEAVLDTVTHGPTKPTVHFDKLRPIARLGGNTYGIVNTVFDLPRPDRKV
eukprot:TRINITY_DN2197_c1_g1_i1.p1 TRINITY_DN2197_c1_g1~~TRINITY_DN2197_c1_g1_i1.p1  ORF type:complete len:129 (-),score=26.36 TRINITY_DN2197_c1_g1_i1:542-928(-)